MKPSTKKLISRFATRRELYPKSPNNRTGRKFIAQLDKRARKQYGGTFARKSLYGK